MNEDEKKFNITIPETAVAAGKMEITFLEGKPNVLPIKEPLVVKEDVTIPSIITFIEGRHWGETRQDNEGIFVYCIDPKRAFLDFKTDPQNHYGTVLHASLEESKKMKAFHINDDDHLFSKDQVIKLLKEYAPCFESIAMVKELIAKLQNLEVKFEQYVKENDDRQGNREAIVKEAITQVNGGLQGKEWTLRLPFFEGYADTTIKVEIEIDKIEGSNRPGFSFWSLELTGMIEDAAAEIILMPVNTYASKFIALQKK